MSLPLSGALYERQAEVLVEGESEGRSALLASVVIEQLYAPLQNR